MWQTNGAGRKTSTAFGFGLLDAEEFVRLAEQWPPAIPQQRNCTYVWGGMNNECTRKSLTELVRLGIDRCQHHQLSIKLPRFGQNPFWPYKQAHSCNSKLPNQLYRTCSSNSKSGASDSGRVEHFIAFTPGHHVPVVRTSLQGQGK